MAHNEDAQPQKIILAFKASGRLLTRLLSSPCVSETQKTTPEIPESQFFRVLKSTRYMWTHSFWVGGPGVSLPCRLPRKAAAGRDPAVVAERHRGSGPGRGHQALQADGVVVDDQGRCAPRFAKAGWIPRGTGS